MVETLDEFKHAIIACRDVETALWNYIHKDTIKYTQLLKEHLKLQSFILELYREINFMDEGHVLFNKFNMTSGIKIKELLHSLKIRLELQYSDLYNINEIVKKEHGEEFTNEELANVAETILNRKNSINQNESQNSLEIKNIETEIARLIEANLYVLN